MVIGTVLLQPRKIDPSLGFESGLLEDVLSVAARLGWDATHGRSALDIIQGAVESVLRGIFDHTKAGQAAALAAFQSILQPIADRLTAAVGALPSEADPHEFFVGGEQLFALISDLVASLTVQQVHDFLDRALTIITTDLGLTNEFVQSQVAALFDECIRRLRAAPAGSDPQARANLSEIATLLRRIQHDLEGLFALPALNADRLAGPLFDLLRVLNADSLTQRVSLGSTAAKDLFTIGATLEDLVPFSLGFTGGGPGAAETATNATKKLWYASWVTGDDIRGTDVENDPSLSKYTFKLAKPKGLETLTLVSNVVVNSGNAIFALATGIGRGKYVRTILVTAKYLLAIALAIWADFDMDNLPWYAKGGIVLGIALIANFEGRSFDAGDAWLYFFRLFYNVLGIAGGLPFDKVRDAVLAVITHLNYEGSTDEPLPGDQDTRPLNRNKFDGLTLLLMQTIGALVHALVMPANFFSVGFFEKNQQGDSHHPLGTFFSAVVLGGLGISIVTFFTFGTLAACIPPLWPDGGEAALVWLKGYGASLLGFLGFWYLLNDGKTDDGKRGFLPDDLRGTETAFPGYCDPSISPYLLPYAKDTDQQCVQGNHGIWSHNSTRDIPLDFAYDFSMHRGAEVLCMRAGTVFSVVDDQDNGDNHDGNNIVIRHLETDDHRDRFDLDVQGRLTVTYATYMHAVKGSIAGAFGGAVPAVGTAVPRGKVIMKCNSSGDAFYNLLHVDVRPEAAGKPKDYTIPFVFRDGDVAGDKGVPQSQTYYTSENQQA